MRTALPLLPAWVALALALALEPPRMALGAIVGLAALGSLLVGGAAISVRFGLLAVAGGGMFGVMAAVLAELSGLTAGRLLDTAFTDFWVANTLAVAAVALVVLGLASIVWGRLRGRF